MAMLSFAEMISILFIQFFSLLIFVHGFNVDIKVPIVKVGRPDSYFGYSIAHHHVRSDRDQAGHPVIIVGAPRDNVTDPDAPYEVRRLKRPGVVYQCPLSSYREDCTALKIDQIEPDPYVEDRNDQWMGVSVASQGGQEGKAIACAHRFKKVGASFRWGLGLCISLTNALDEDKPFEPCNAQPKDTGHGQYGFCQAGISSAIDKDGELALGSPGPVNWRGTVFMNSVVDSLDGAAEWFHAPVEDPRQGYNDPSPAMDGYYSYLGMSVKIGQIVAGKKTVVAGSPRAKDNGQVLLFQVVGKELKVAANHYLTGDQFGSYFGYDVAIGDFNKDGSDDLAVGAPFYHGPGIGGAIYIYMNGPEGITSLSQPHKIVSRKMKDTECSELDCHNARFGFALASIGDVNQDNFPDLAVGAPYEGKGVVYIFHGSPSGILKDYSQRIDAADFASGPVPSAFGASVAAAGDLDNNGYPDIIVGSFMSSNIHILRSRPVIELHTDFRSVDALIDPKMTQCPSTGDPRICFTLSVCLRFTAKPFESAIYARSTISSSTLPDSVNLKMSSHIEFNERITVVYTLEAEKFAGAKISRVQFARISAVGDSSNITNSLTLNPQSSNQNTCERKEELLVYIAKETRDFLNPIPFQLSFRLKDEREPRMNPGDSLPDLNTYPILSAKSVKQQIKVDFMKDCGSDSVCESDLSLTTRLNLVRDSEGDYVLNVGTEETLEVAIKVVNKGEDAHEAMVTISLPPSFKYEGLGGKSNKQTCVPEPEENLVRCSLGNPMKAGRTEDFSIRLDTQSALPSDDKFMITAVVNTSSVELNPSDDITRMSLKIIVQTDLMIRAKSKPESVQFSGEIKGESAIRFEDDIGSEVYHIYEIKNVGKVRVPRSRVNVKWPYEIGTREGRGKHLLYVMEDPELEGQGICFMERRYKNPLNVQPPRIKQPRIENGTAIAVTDNEGERGSRSRSRRDTSPRGMELKIGGGGGTVVLDCDSNTAHCFDFYCELGELLPGTSMVINIRARLWDSTFLQHYTDVQEVLVYSKAEVIIDPKLEIRQLDYTNDMEKAVTKVYPSKDVQEPGTIPWWIILIGVLLGVFFLVLLIVILWKCGFFKRQKHDQMMEHKAKVEKYDDYHD